MNTIQNIIGIVIGVYLGILALYLFLEWINGELEKAVEGRTIHEAKLEAGCLMLVAFPLYLWTIFLDLLFLPVNLVKYVNWKVQAPKRERQELERQQAEAKRRQEEEQRKRIEDYRKKEEHERYINSPEYQKLQREKQQMEEHAKREKEKAEREKAIKYLSLHNPTADPSQFSEFAINAAIEQLEQDNANTVAQQNRLEIEQQHIADMERAQDIQREQRQREERKRYYYQVLCSRIGQTVHIESSEGHYVTGTLLDVNSDNAIFDSGIKYQPTRIPLDSITFIQ